MLGPVRATAFDVVGEHRRSGDEDRVVRGEQRLDLVAPRRQEAGELRVGLGEGLARGVRRRPDREAGLLGERDRRIPPAAVGAAGADHQRGLGRAVEQRGDAVDPRGVGQRAQGELGQAGQLAVAVPVVDRDRHEHRPHRRGQRGDEGADQRQRHVLGAGRLDRPLDERAREFGRALGIEERVVRQDRAGLLPRCYDQRGVVLVRGEQVAERVAGAGRAVQVDQRRALRGPRVAVGHAHHHRLVEPHHVGKRQRLEHRQLGRAGIAEQAIDPEVLEHAEGGFSDGRHALALRAGPPRSATLRRPRLRRARGRAPGFRRG